MDGAEPGSTIDIPAGTFLIDRQIAIRKPLTLRTAPPRTGSLDCRAAPATCATLVAAPAFADQGGLLVLASTSDVSLLHIAIDGNRLARMRSDSAADCYAGRNGAGFNARALDCLRCMLDDVVSMNALCGTGFEWTGAAAVIQRSTFRDNGDGAIRRMWADGLTLLYAPYSRVTDNLFLDNSDVGVIVGHGAYSFLARNRIVQRRQHAFAGLMLDNFNSGDLAIRGDFTGATITANEVDCGLHMCGFGIELGPHPWYNSPNIAGGEVTGNRIVGAGVGINIDGAGRRDAPIAVYANTVLMVEEEVAFRLCGQTFETSAIDIAKDAVVNRRGDTAYTVRRRDWHKCQ